MEETIKEDRTLERTYKHMHYIEYLGVAKISFQIVGNPYKVFCNGHYLHPIEVASKTYIFLSKKRGSIWWMSAASSEPFCFENKKITKGMLK